MRYSESYWEDVRLVSKHIPQVEKLKNKKVLITGATGMVCSSVVEILELLNRELNAGIKIVLAGRSEERIKERFNRECEYEFILYDANKECELNADVDFIIHGASNANPILYAENPVETLLGNIIGTNTLLKLAKSKDARLLYISSSEIYGGKNDNYPYSEADYGFVDILSSRACYPNGKRAAETLCIAYGDEYGVDTVIVRPGHIYGPAITTTDMRASAQFTRRALQGEKIIMKSAGTQMRSYCYTLDCASAILTVLLHGKIGSAYNISNRNSVVTIRELAETLAKYSGTEIVFTNPSDRERKGYNLMTNSSLDSRKLEELGWSAHFDLNNGVKRMLETLKQ